MNSSKFVRDQTFCNLDFNQIHMCILKEALHNAAHIINLTIMYPGDCRSCVGLGKVENFQYFIWH